MAISMVRKPSETPNITNIDDIIPFRYAYGNQNGYVIGRGAEVSHTVNGNQFTVNSGRLVIQGVESDIDANGITLTIDSVSETRYYAVYHEINLATNTSNIKVEFDTATYPNITEGDDLTANSSGIARLVLYKFIAQSGVISGVEKVVKAIQYTKDIQVENAKTVNSLEIKQDENGVLKIGDIIIPQKILLFNSDSGVYNYDFNDDIKNRTFEIHLTTANKSQTYINKVKIPTTLGLSLAQFRFVYAFVNSEKSINYYTLYFNGSNNSMRVETTSWKVTETTETTSQNLKILKIYEIIE